MDNCSFLGLLLSESFFNMLISLMKIRDMLKSEIVIKNRLTFKNSIKSKLLLLSNFELSYLKDFNLEKTMRLQYLLENFLQFEIDEASLQNYTRALMKEHELLILNIVTKKPNVELIIKEVTKGNYMYFEFLAEVIEVIRYNSRYRESIYKMMIQSGLIECIIQLISNFKFHNIDDVIVVSVENSYFKHANNVLTLVHMICILTEINSHHLTDLWNPNSDHTGIHDIFKFLISVLFQSTETRLHSLVCQTISNLVSNINNVSKNPKIIKSVMVQLFLQFSSNFCILKNLQFFDFLEIFADLKENDIIIELLEYSNILIILLSELDLRKHKIKTMKFIKILDYIGSININYIGSEFLDMLIIKLIEAKVKNGTSMLFYSIFRLFQKFNLNIHNEIKNAEKRKITC